MGIEKVNARIADIQSRMIAMQTQQATRTVQKQNQPASAPASASGEAFASYLKDAVATGSATLNSQGIPTDLAAYGNGKIPANALAQVGNTRHKLWAPAAQALTRMIADAKAEGVDIGITDSYRPYAEQVDLARRKGLYSQGGLAAKPGTSEHGWGLATDLDLNGKALSWMKANAEKYGYVNNVPREDWHWEFKPA